MDKRKYDTRWLVGVALMAAIVIVLAFTPLGMIQLPFIKATTVHIPVIVGAILYGPLAGVALGCVFGVCSLISNTITPSVLSFVFSPFIYANSPFVENPTFGGGVSTVWISVGCRMLVGLIPGLLWLFFKKISFHSIVKLTITGIVGSLTNTVAVMGSIYILFSRQYAVAYAETKKIAASAAWRYLMGTVGISAIFEAIAAAILVAVITKVLMKIRVKAAH